MSIAENLESIRERIAQAARRAGRSPDDVALMAVTKTFRADAIREAYDAGQRLFGENRVQEFAGKVDALRDLRDAEFHMIGHLQTNKATKALEVFSAIDSVDSLKLAEKLDAVAEKIGKCVPVLIELNLGGEESKSGVAPDLNFAIHSKTGAIPAGTSELMQLLLAAPRLRHLDFRGLMTIPPFTDNAEETRPYFRRLREIRDEIAACTLPDIRMDTLSMGMSHDFEVAIEEGSTCVRLGTAIFGQRPNP